MIGQVVCLLAVVVAVVGQIRISSNVDAGRLSKTPVSASDSLSQAARDAIDERLTNMETSLYTVARQLMLQRLALEESLRSDGHSGVKQIRVNQDGTRAYYSASHVGRSTVAIHDHTELQRTCGMGEFEGVLNGVHFRTRHNDYKLVKPSSTSSDYHAVEAIAYPPVPPEILSQTDLTTAFRDMRAYFRAWLDGDDSQLDYKPYFKPLLCYLEGAWTNDVNLDEPFDSDRHHLDASSWFDLQEKVRFTSYTGDKDQLENFAFLPTAIVNITDGVPVLAQWNYRILCHPIQDDLLELQHLKPTDELQSRLPADDLLDEWLQTRKGHYHVTDRNGDQATSNGQALIDKLMAQIPGKDNYMADIEDNNLGRSKYDIFDNTQLLNAGFYHRYVYIGDKDAMGVQVNMRGFGDRNLFVAHTTQSRVAPVELAQCNWQGEDCVYSRTRVSYAIPLEIVWTTPLNSWNPLDLEYKGVSWTPEGATVTADGRTGGLTSETALNGTNDRNYFLTPIQFFQGGEIEVDPADTVPGSVGVLDRWGNVRALTASGIRIFLPEILDVGNVRTRFPIFPVYADGNTAFKDLEALSKITMDLTANTRYLHNVPQFGSNDTDDDVIQPDPDLTWYRMQTAPSNSSRGTHIHYLDLRTMHAIYAMDGCETYQIRTSLSKRHTHLMTIHFNSTSQQFEYLDCDGRPTCRDNHGVQLTPIRE